MDDVTSHVASLTKHVDPEATALLLLNAHAQHVDNLSPILEPHPAAAATATTNAHGRDGGTGTGVVVLLSSSSLGPANDDRDAEGAVTVSAGWMATLLNDTAALFASEYGVPDDGVGGNGTTNNGSTWWANDTSGADTVEPVPRQYWALVLMLFPLFTVFGNVLVILSVYRERNLQNVTNYFIVSLAVADLLVAALVMPFAVYVLVNVNLWELSSMLCDFYIAMDVICSTSSILNLVAISIDRYMAVTRPLTYAKPQNNTRVVMTVALVWFISVAIGSPIVLGLNTAPDKDPQLCIFYNSDFIIYSSLSSFYIPCIIMVVLYYRIFSEIHKIARDKAKKTAYTTTAIRQSSRMEMGGTGPHLQETALLTKHAAPSGASSPAAARTSNVAAVVIVAEPDQPTNTESGSQEDDEQQQTPVSEDCHIIIPNARSTECMIQEEPAPDGDNSVRKSRPAEALTPPASTIADKNGNNDSGYAASMIEEPATVGLQVTLSQVPEPPMTTTMAEAKVGRRNGAAPQLDAIPLPPTNLPSVKIKKKKKSRFTMPRSKKNSCKRRENPSAKRERKATKTLAIVLAVFLICWVPFFTCNIMDALCTKLHKQCQPSLTAFLLTTWLGYMNSFINPVIYTIFNLEFRKAFKKLLTGKY